MCNENGGCANTRDCFRFAVGHKVVGVLFDSLPVSRRDLSRGNATLVFDCGCGLTISAKGTYWLESPQEIQRAADVTRGKLAECERESRDVLALAGQLENTKAHD